MDPEKPVYDKYIPLLRKYKYGTPEYKKVREEIWRLKEKRKQHPGQSNASLT